MTRLVLASAEIKSVCLAKKAGNCMISKTSEAFIASSCVWTSDIIGILNSSFILLKIFKPFSIPGPLKDLEDDLLALS